MSDPDVDAVPPSMKSHSSVWIGIVVLIGATLYEPARASAQETPPAPVLSWLSSESDGLRMAAERSQAMLLAFSADWSPASNEIDRVVWKDLEVRQAACRFVAVRLDGSASSVTARSGAFDRAADKYRIMRLPTVLVMDAHGRILDRIEGLVSATEMARRLRAGERAYAQQLARR